MKDTIKRSITKTASWRVIAVLSSFAITFIWLGSFNQTLSLTIALNISAMVLYYFHERVWNLTHWGKHEKK